VSLASLLSSCFDIYDKTSDIRGTAEDLEVRKLRFVQKRGNSGTLDSDAKDVMILAQQQINERLKRIQATILKYFPEQQQQQLELNNSISTILPTPSKPQFPGVPCGF